MRTSQLFFFEESSIGEISFSEQMILNGICEAMKYLHNIHEGAVILIDYTSRSIPCLITSDLKFFNQPDEALAFLDKVFQFKEDTFEILTRCREKMRKENIEIPDWYSCFMINTHLIRNDRCSVPVPVIVRCTSIPNRNGKIMATLATIRLSPQKERTNVMFYNEEKRKGYYFDGCNDKLIVEDFNINQRDREILLLSYGGRKSSEIATILGIASIYFVDSRLKSLRKRFHATTTEVLHNKLHLMGVI